MVKIESEADLAKATRHLLRYSGLVHWRVSNGPVMHTIGKKTIFKPSEIKGFPDWAGICPDGVFWALELKSPKKSTVTKEQYEWMDKITGSNAICGIANSLQNVIQFIEMVGGKVPKTS